MPEDKYLIDYDELPPYEERRAGTLKGIKEEDYADQEDSSWQDWPEER